MKIEEANKILEISLTRDIALDKEAAKKIKTAKKVFINHYKDNPKAFIEDYFKILHGDTNEECDFILNEAQDAVIEALRSSSCLLYTSPSPRDRQKSRMPSSA